MKRRGITALSSSIRKKMRRKAAGPEVEEDIEPDGQQNKPNAKKRLLIDSQPSEDNPSPSDKCASKPQFRFLLLNADLRLIRGKKKLLATADRGRKDGLAAAPRPDLLHQSLMMILDSPCCKRGFVAEIWILNLDGKLFKVNPKFRIPRTWKVFEKVMTMLVTSPTGDLRAPDTQEVLIKLMEPPLSRYISHTVDKCALAPVVIENFSARTRDPLRITVRNLVGRALSAAARTNQTTVTFAVRLIEGQDCHKNFDIDLQTGRFAISNSNLHPAIMCNRLCNSIEAQLGLDWFPKEEESEL